jgi:mannose-6-phosphate isomerase-like protein (cupin superfamily)
VYDITFQNAGVLTSQPHARGAVEQLAVLDGRVKVTSGTAISEIAVGDTARYAADVPHEIAAIGGPARVFLIVKSTA